MLFRSPGSTVTFALRYRHSEQHRIIDTELQENMALSSLLKLVALCALFHEAAAFAPEPPLNSTTFLGGSVRGLVCQHWQEFDDRDYPATNPADITLTISPQNGFNSAFIEGAKHVAELAGKTVIVVNNYYAKAWLKHVGDLDAVKRGLVKSDKDHKVYACF